MLGAKVEIWSLLLLLPLAVQGAVIQVTAGGEVSVPTYMFSDSSGSSVATLTGNVTDGKITASGVLEASDVQTTGGVRLSFPAEIRMFAGSTAPTGWMLCDGAAISRTSYSALFAAIGDTFGSGDGSSTFNLPNFINRSPLGAGTRSVGTTGGGETHALQASELPSHTHGFTTNFLTSTSGAHTHEYPMGGDIQKPAGGGGAEVRYHRAEYNDCTDLPSPSWCGGYTHNTFSGGEHEHSGTVSGTTGSAGSGAAHSIMSPFLAINFIIKT